MARAVTLRDAAGEYTVRVTDGEATVDGAAPVSVRLEGDGVIRVDSGRAWVRSTGEKRWVFFDGQVYVFETAGTGRGRRSGSHQAALSAPMPATVIRLQAAPGDHVTRGQVLIVLEAMKMELPIKAPHDGIVTAVHCQPGELVQPGVGLIEVQDIASKA